MYECPRIHARRDFYKASIVSKSGRNEERNREFERNINRKKFNFLLKWDEVVQSIIDFREENTEIIELYDQIVEGDEDYFYYKK